jgi:hypothetical protein
MTSKPPRLPPPTKAAPESPNAAVSKQCTRYTISSSIPSHSRRYYSSCFSCFKLYRPTMFVSHRSHSCHFSHSVNYPAACLMFLFLQLATLPLLYAPPDILRSFALVSKFRLLPSHAHVPHILCTNYGFVAFGPKTVTYHSPDAQ